MDPARWNEISRYAAAAETGGAEREAPLAAHPGLRAQPGPPGNFVYPLIGLQRFHFFHFFRGDSARAKALCEEAHRVTFTHGGPNHPNTAVALSALALALAKTHLGETDAEALASQSVVIQRAAFPAGHIEIVRVLTFLGRVLLKAGDPRAAEAAPLFDAAAAEMAEVLPATHPRFAELRVLRYRRSITKL